MENLQTTVDYTKNILYVKEYRETKDPAALEFLITNNRLMLYKVARKYAYYYKHKLELDDLVSAGVEGLMKAIDRFDLDSDNAFSTYAMYWVKQSITRAIFQDGFTIRIPVHLFESFSKLNKLEKEASTKGMTDPKSYVMKELGLSEEGYEDLKALQAYTLTPGSTNAIISRDDNSTELQDVLEQSQAIDSEVLGNPEKALEDNERRIDISKLILHLKPRDREIIEQRYGLNGTPPKTLAEVGAAHGLSRERIRQLEKRALRTLRVVASRQRRLG